jgi:excisionase family DNA binding protein
MSSSATTASASPTHPISPASRTEDLRATIEHECMTACELASWLRVNRKTVYEYAARNVIPCRRLGRRLVFSRSAVAAWLARASTLTAPPTLASGRR